MILLYFIQVGQKNELPNELFAKSAIKSDDSSAQQQPVQQQQAPYNPFDSGIQKAIASARMLGMTQQQEENALTNSLLTFGENIAQMPREKGLLNNIGSFGRALSPAIRSYNNSEDAALAENNALANQILAYKAAEEQRAAQAEDRAWHRQIC